VSPAELAGRIGAALLAPSATRGEVEVLCARARARGLLGVCVNPSQLAAASEALRGSPVRVVAVVGFPLGASLAEVKVYEAMQCVLQGAQELDVVMNIAWAREGRWEALRQELQAVVMATPQAVHKVILETAYLSRQEMLQAARVAAEAGARFVKTSTGHAPRGATVEDVRALREVLPQEVGIKASGGIKTLGQALALLQAGAQRLGTSAWAEILQEAERAP